MHMFGEYAPLKQAEDRLESVRNTTVAALPPTYDKDNFTSQDNPHSILKSKLNQLKLTDKNIQAGAPAFVPHSIAAGPLEPR